MKKITIIIMVLFLLCGCTSTNTNKEKKDKDAIVELNPNKGAVKKIPMQDVFNKMENKECFYYKLSTLYYGICITQKTIQWCQHIRMQKPLSDLIQDKKS